VEITAMMSSTEANIKARRGMLWRACNKMDQIWKSYLNRTLKIRLLISTVKAVLLYGCDVMEPKHEAGTRT